jgi:hypothetical protein
MFVPYNALQNSYVEALLTMWWHLEMAFRGNEVKWYYEGKTLINIFNYIYKETSKSTFSLSPYLSPLPQFFFPMFRLRTQQEHGHLQDKEEDLHQKLNYVKVLILDFQSL